MGGVPLDRFDEVGDQVEATLQFDVDLLPGLRDQVPLGD